MLLSSEGVVISSLKYGDSSIISKVFSKERGLISLISNRPKKKRGGASSGIYQAFNLVQFVCYFSNRSSVHRIKEIQFSPSSKPDVENVPKNALKFFLAEFISKVIKEEEQNANLYDFLEKKVISLNTHQDQLGSFHIRFLVELLEEIGIHPLLMEKDHYFDLLEGTSCGIRPSHPNFYEGDDYLLFYKAFFQPEKLGKLEKSRLLSLLISFYNVQLGGGLENLKSRSVLEVVFN
jgi:DNA repair protein RecO (recombination protein O)